MKDREARHDVQKQETQTPQEAARSRFPEQVPLQVYAQLLSGRAELTELSEPLLQTLAQAVGNSSLTALLRGGSAGGPALHMPEEPKGEHGLLPNEIRTSPPRLTSPAAWSGTEVGRPYPANPQDLAERGS